MKREIVVHEHPKAPISESIRLLRTNLSFFGVNKKSKSFLVTSSMPGEGKSWISSNLAISFAQTEKRTLIVDADLRKGRQHKIFEKPNNMGLSDYLRSANEIEDTTMHSELLQKIIVNTEVPNLYLITSGTIPPNPSEILGSDAFDGLVEMLEKNFDVIIFDMPPVSIVADSLVVCKKTDAVVLVAASDITKKEILLNSKNSIQKIGGNIAGVVLNMVPMDRRKDYNKYYSQYMGTSTDTTSEAKRRRG